MAKVNIRESLGRLDLLTDNKYDLRNTYGSSNISNDKKRMLAESLNNNASAKQIYNILNESFEKPSVNVTEEMSDTIRTGMLSGMVGNDIWEVFFESGPTDVLDSDLEDISDDVFDGRLSGKTSRGIGWQIRVGYNDDYYDYNCLNCPEDDYVGSRWEEYDESLNEEDNFNSDEYERKHILRLAKSVEEASKRKGMNIDNLKKTAKRYIENHKDTKNKKELDELIKAYKSLDEKEECLEEDTVKQNGKWVNKGSEGTHGKFRTKKAADAQRKAMFANGYKGESLKEELVDVSDYERVHDESRGGKVYALYRKIENGRGVWAADEISSKTFEPEGRPFRITYRQAIGDEPINNSEKLGMRLGKMLLPKNESLEESVEDDYMKHADADARKVKSLYRKNKDIGSAFSSLGYTDNGDGSYEKEVEDNVFIVF